MIADAPPPPRFRLHELEQIDSTNEEIRRLIAAGAGPGVVVRADRQTQGRGRHGRVWASPPGNLYASVLLAPDGPLAASAQLSFVAGLALAEALEQHGPGGVKMRLKWPNDVLIGPAKVAGILLESAGKIAGDRSGVIIGTGVNIVSHPDDTPYPATCLLDQGYAPIAPTTLLASYLGALDRWLAQWRQNGFARIREAWRGRGIGLGEQIRLRLPREELSGRFVDLTPNGALLLDMGADGRREITAGDVFYPGA